MARRATAGYAALAAADTLLAASGHARQRWLTKPLLMPVLMAGLVMATYTTAQALLAG